MRHLLAGLGVGLLFGAGLGLSGMTDPAVVLGFLDVTGSWNPALAFVMAGALVVTFLGYRLAWRRPAPLWADRFQLPTSTAIDLRLIGGAALFGIGWGLAGWCPGPAIASLSLLTSPLIAFLAAMLAGLAAVRFLVQRRA
ncbi:MAG: DUF6691 family protein [Geminicoccaceae bacterium]